MLEAVRRALTHLWVGLYEADHDAGTEWLLDCLRCLPASEQAQVWHALPGVALSLGETISHRSGSTEPTSRGRKRSVRIPPAARMPRIDAVASCTPVPDATPTEPQRVPVWRQEEDETWQP